MAPSVNRSRAPLLGQGGRPRREKLTCEPTRSGKTFCTSAVAHGTQWLAGRRTQGDGAQAAIVFIRIPNLSMMTFDPSLLSVCLFVSLSGCVLRTQRSVFFLCFPVILQKRKVWFY